MLSVRDYDHKILLSFLCLCNRFSKKSMSWYFVARFCSGSMMMPIVTALFNAVNYRKLLIRKETTKIFMGLCMFPV